MKQLIIGFMMAAVSFVGMQAHAFYIEPYLGYETGKIKASGNEADATGTGLGVRLGDSTLGLSYGVDLMTSSGKAKSSTSDQDRSATDWGIFVGYQFPVLVRAYATYFLSSSAKIGTTEMSGSGTRIGVGFTGFPFVSVNLEMLNKTYTKQTAPTSGDISDSGSNTTMLSISLPF